jgi:hypothetical protein
MQKYIEENFLKEHQVTRMDPLGGWVEKPDLLRLITIEPSHFSNGFDQRITKIHFGELSCCYNLVSLDLSSLCNLKEIESCAFRNSWSLQEIKFPPSLEKISSGSFTDCLKLVKLDLSHLSKMTIIETDLFKNFWALQEISFPPNIRKIGTRCLKNCTNLVRLDLSNCEQLEEIGYDSFVSAWGLQEIIFPRNLRKILAGAFLECTSLTRLDFSNCVQFEEFGNNVFTDAFSLGELILPQNLQKISHHAFRNCISLVRLRIPATVSEIEKEAFSGCVGLQEIIFDNIAGIKIHERAFQNCPLLVIPSPPRRYPGFRYGKYSELKGSLQFGQGTEGGICGISLEEFQDDSDIVVLPCGHAYFEEAFNMWISRQNICPTCKVAL